MSYRFGERTWTDLAGPEAADLICLLPLGAVEAHGPHLPLLTDGIMSQAVAESAAAVLSAAGLTALVLPRIDYSAAPFAAAFPGTVSIRPETLTALIVDIAGALEGQARVLALVNCHLDPTHLASVEAAIVEIEVRLRLPVVFPNLTRKPWALHLGDEFMSGACHAGQFEGSVVLAAAPELVRQEISAALPENPASISRGIRAGATSFAEAGGEQAYFGNPAAATAEEGRRTIDVLAGMLVELVEGELEKSKNL